MRGPIERIVSALLVSAALVGLSHPAFSQAERQDLEEVKQSIAERRAEDEKLAARSEDVATDLAALKRKQIRIASEIQDTEASLSETEAELSALDQEIDRTTQALRDANADLPRILGALALLSRDPPDALLAMPATADEAMRTAALLGRILPDLDRRAASLRGDVAELSALHASRSALRAEMTAAHDRLAKEREALDASQAEKATMQRKLVGERRKLAEEITMLGAQAENLESLLERLADAQATREAEAVAARRAREGLGTLDTAPAPSKTGGETVAMAVPPPPPVTPPSLRPEAGAAPVALPAPMKPPPETWPKISGARGRLKLPAQGTMVQRFAARTEEGGTSRGIVFSTRPDAQVVAPFAGQVAFAGPFRGYGQLLIIEHSEGYHSLLAGFSRIDCVVGQWLQTGEPVGVMGGRSENGARLYIELRQNGQPIDPLPWLQSGNRKVNG